MSRGKNSIFPKTEISPKRNNVCNKWDSGTYRKFQHISEITPSSKSINFIDFHLALSVRATHKGKLRSKSTRKEYYFVTARIRMKRCFAWILYGCVLTCHMKNVCSFGSVRSLSNKTGSHGKIIQVFDECFIQDLISLQCNYKYIFQKSYICIAYYLYSIEKVAPFFSINKHMVAVYIRTWKHRHILGS